MLRGIAGQVERLGDEADFFTVFALVRNVDLGGRIGADQDHRQARGTQALLAALRDTLGDLLAQVGGDRLAIDKVCSHRRVINHREGNNKEGAFSHDRSRGQRRVVGQIF